MEVLLFGLLDAHQRLNSFRLDLTTDAGVNWPHLSTVTEL
jgi:hypothetical protein